MKQWLIVCRRRCSRNGAGVTNIGPSSQRRGSQHQGASGCSCNAGLSPVCDGGLGHADPWGPPGSGSPRRCWESAEAGAGSISHTNQHKCIRSEGTPRGSHCSFLCSFFTLRWFVSISVSPYKSSSLSVAIFSLLRLCCLTVLPRD